MENKVEKDVKSPPKSSDLKASNGTKIRIKASKLEVDKGQDGKVPKPKESKQDKEKEKEKEKDKQKVETDKKEDIAEEEEEEEDIKKEEEVKKVKAVAAHRNGAHVLAKVQGKASKNVWFAAKVISSRPTALGPFEYHVIYTDDQVKDVKEWVPGRFVTSPIPPDAPPAPASSLGTGTLALGWRKKPGAQEGWWHSVKVLRYLNDVPGAFVSWSDFPFPDSILEAGKVFPIIREPPKEEKEKAKDTEKEKEPPQTGLKRQLSDGGSESSAKKEKIG